MDESAKDLINQALELSAPERIAIAEQLLMSLDKPDDEVDALWSKEADERVAAYENGEIKTASLEDVFSKYKKP